MGRCTLSNSSPHGHHPVNTQGETKGETTYRDIASFTRMSRPTRGAGASAAALAMCAMDPDDTEGAEPQPVDAEEKNMAGDGKKRRVERTYVAPSRPHPPHIHTYLLPPTRQSPLPSSASTCRHSSVAIVRGRASSSSPTPTVRAPPLSRHPHRPRTAVPFPYAPRPHTLSLPSPVPHTEAYLTRASHSPTPTLRVPSPLRHLLRPHTASLPTAPTPTRAQP